MTEWIVAVATVLGLLLVAWQIREGRRQALQAAATQSWTEYLRLGLENPELGEARMALQALGLKSADELVSGDTIGSQRYLWFLSIMMEAAENLIAAFPTDAWRLTVEENLRYHQPALEVLWESEAQFYTTALNEYVARVLVTPQND